MATVLGLRGWPAAAEEMAVARDLAVLADVIRDVPGARLHLTHVSTAGALDLVRRAKAAGLPVTCDVTPHHLALTDEWVAGARRWAWDASGDPWSDGAITVGAVRLLVAGQPAAPGAGRCGGVPGRAPRRHGRCGRDRPRPAHRGRQGRRVRGGGQRDQRHRDRVGRAPGGRGCRAAPARSRHRGADDGSRGRPRRADPPRRFGRSRRKAPGPTSWSSIARSVGPSPPTGWRRAARTRRCSGWSSAVACSSRSPTAGSPTRRPRPSARPVADRQDRRPGSGSVRRFGHGPPLGGG